VGPWALREDTEFARPFQAEELFTLAFWSNSSLRERHNNRLSPFDTLEEVIQAFSSDT
jgi:hypothetical protein